jgi:WD40 repeat protein
MAPDGSFVAVGDNAGRVLVLPLDGGSARELRGFSDMIQTVAVGPEGRLVAAGAGFLFPQDAVVRVWDLETGEVRVVDAGDGEPIRGPLRFTDAEDLFVWSGNRVRRWDLSGPTPGVVDEFDLSLPRFGGGTIYKDVTPDGRQLVLSKDGRDWIQDLETGATRDLSHVEPGPGGEYRLTLDPSKDLVVSSNGPGAVGVAPVGSSDVHVLARHEGWEAPPCISPDGQWIATGGEDGTIRLWPMPDLSKPPLHTLPREELIAKLKSLTNLRAVADPGSPTGWKIEVGPFPGWEEVPTW